MRVQRPGFGFSEKELEILYCPLDGSGKAARVDELSLTSSKSKSFVQPSCGSVLVPLFTVESVGVLPRRL